MAGADIIETNTFSSTSVSMADYHVQEYVREMNLAAVRLAREVADEFSTPDKPRFVAGSIGPTNKTCSMSPDVNNPAMRALTYDELADAYREQMEALLEGGVDALLIETIFDTLNAKAAYLCRRKGDGGYRYSSSCLCCPLLYLIQVDALCRDRLWRLFLPPFSMPISFR